ncbi:hypothetical protein ASG89_05985 [Paenibacillus sp. Soil766]|uniref:prepilin-type N-terminal cleavage/methylation domain-containing protein n=1 Tax=Paenibacillus sp. Soil766 TaxID=1736404 RepID=UPI00070CC6C2|nr:prepilin-type N-terminal cleavage/methylation domain-containing protein [Paenibacillus sp. Soil766]KRE93060.1 hypothetical protein ASG89_05985 [Paenibacillus sp. Soil766]
MSAALLALQHNASQAWQEHVHNQNKPRGGNEMNAMVMENKQIKGFKAPKMSFRDAMKNEKGLTLIELLAVIVIIAIIAAIAIPSISTIIEKSKQSAHRSNAHMLVDAARLYISGEGVNVSTTAPTIINMEKMKALGYLQSVPQDPSNKGETYNAGTFTAPNTGGTDGSLVEITNTAGVFSYTVTLVGKQTTAVTYMSDLDEEKIDTEALDLP